MEWWDWYFVILSLFAYFLLGKCFCLFILWILCGFLFVSFKYAVCPNQISILQIPILFSPLKASPSLHTPKPRTTTSCLSCFHPHTSAATKPQSFYLWKVPLRSIHSLWQQLSHPLAVLQATLSFAAECNLEQLFWRQIWKYISIVLKIFIPSDPAITPYEEGGEIKGKNKDFFFKQGQLQ